MCIAFLLNAYNLLKINVAKRGYMMTEDSIIQKVKDSYFDDLTIRLEELKKMLREVMPVEGYVDHEIFEEDGVTTFVFKDYYNEDKWDAADLLCKLTINSEGIIQAVEHDIPPYINNINKRIMLFLSGLVGKEINYKMKDDHMVDPLEPVVDYLYD
ncbi:hypothetical protein [Desulfosporosinus meridiei]|uniref:Uncharacterized protein n=1 Tax=Desulfosporosinus meridiei (strain ATCC BAA-275 / DSM 13257 / KCTC 12902 / NCIMB 13706 / S10) TaxID=768704 RepID=J7INF6_DESMD|nr:hypothetical protein [Desulfosporosinus meridiei]AFQ43332.1 hypothetical protein Desmer_1323 [Desulfosporosinus meridiei DSM 13257]